MSEIINETHTLVSLIAPTNVATAEAATTVTSSVIDANKYAGDGLLLAHAAGLTVTGTVVSSLLASAGSESIAGYAGSDTTDVALRNGATDNITAGIKFTPTLATIQTIDKCYVRMKKAGTVAAGASYIKLEVQTDNTGVPSNTVLATAGTLDPGTFGTAYAYHMFTFATPIELTSGTAYHFVLSGDWSASSSNHVKLSCGTVASGGTLGLYDSNWANISTQKPNFNASGFAWTAAGATTSTTTASLSKVGFNFDHIGRSLRAKTLVTPANASSNRSIAVSMLARPKGGMGTGL